MDVAKLAALARIKLTEEEEQELSNEFPAILNFVNQINKVELQSMSKDDEEYFPLNIMREDDNPNTKRKMTEKLLSSSPDRSGDYIKVKKIL